MPKKTRLDDDAAIYQQRDNRTEKVKLRDMPWDKRISHLWEYYKYHAILTIVFVAFVSYTIYSFVKPKVEIKLYTAIINNTIQPQIWDDYQSTLIEYLDLNPKTEKVVLNYSFYFNSTPDYEANMRQAFGVYTAASEIDVVIAPLSEFSAYVEYGFFAPLSEQLPTDLYSSLTDRYYISGTEDDPKPTAYGIYIEDTKIYREHSLPTDDDPVLMGILINSLHKENSVEFIRCIFDE